MLRVGVIGCGGMGRDHIRRLTRRSREQVVAVSDVFEESARKSSRDLRSKVYADSKGSSMQRT